MSAKKKRGSLVRVQHFSDSDYRILQVDYIEKLLQHFAQLYTSHDPVLASLGRKKLREVAETLADNDAVRYMRINSATAAAAKARRAIGERTRTLVETQGEDAPVSDRHRRRLKAKKR